MSSVMGIGVSATGDVDQMLGVIEEVSNRAGWRQIPIVRILEDAFGLPVYLDNDVRATALTMQLLTPERRVGGVLYVAVGGGIGTAFVRDQEIMHGDHDAACRIGHTVVDVDGPVCECGNRGCLETVASEMAFIGGIWPGSRKPRAEMLPAERADLVRRGVMMARDGDPTGSESLARVMRYLGVGLANAINTLDPKSILIGGTMFDVAPDLMIDLVRRQTLLHTVTRARGVEISVVPQLEDMLRLGSAGLALAHPYRVLHEENARARHVAGTR